MAFSDSKGNKFTNHSAMKSSEARLKAKMPEGKSPAALESPDGEAPEQDMGGEDPHAVVQAHGPATHVAIDHTAGHKVESMHADGHKHQDMAASAGEAHDMGKCLSGDCDCAGGM